MNRILVYNGYGTKDDVILFGHLFRRYTVKEVYLEANSWSNLKNAIRKYRIKTESNYSFKLEINGVVKEVLTNELGYFRVHFKPGKCVTGWNQVQLVYEKGELTADYLILDNSPIIISDIDDTLLYSMVHNFWKKMRLLMFKNGLQRKKVGHYDQIQSELLSLLNGHMTPNVFYVSNSEWNLYPMLKNFVEMSGLTRGVFQLNKLKVGVKELVLNAQKASRHGHKQEALKYLFDKFSDHQFILVGDTGQHDPAIYAEIIELNKERILGVIFRRSGSIRANELNEIELNRIRDFNVPSSVID